AGDAGVAPGRLQVLGAPGIRTGEVVAEWSAPAVDAGSGGDHGGTGEHHRGQLPRPEQGGGPVELSGRGRTRRCDDGDPVTRPQRAQRVTATGVRHLAPRAWTAPPTAGYGCSRAADRATPVRPGRPRRSAHGAAPRRGRRCSTPVRGRG